VLTVLDDKENIVNAVPIPKPGENKLQWNGTKMDGTRAAAGKYTLKVTTLDGTNDTGYAYLQDRVSGITFSKDGMRLEVGGQQVGMDQIIHVGDEAVAGE
jgi:flagellar hook assembly protein FlgD